MILLDGSEGEGGGQILRSALSLAMLTGKPFKLTNIRANRPKPGLRPQHLAAVKAAAQVCGAQYKGAAVDSSVLVFEPGPVQAGDYTIRIGTAGATGLVLHTLALPLALQGAEQSSVTITGGTHLPNAPSAEFLRSTWAGYMTKLGLPLSVTMTQPGFYPRGGGELRAVIAPVKTVRPLSVTAEQKLTTAGGFVAVANLPRSIAEKMAARLRTNLNQAKIEHQIEVEEWTNGPGVVAGIVFRQTTVPTVITELGEKGRPGDSVIDALTQQALDFRERGATVDAHSADQLLLPLAFADGRSEFRVTEVTKHLRTNLDTIMAFVPRQLTCTPGLGGPGTVTIEA
jgi:RNA 3'-terminal phosphate cyclase (ATP)